MFTFWLHTQSTDNTNIEWQLKQLTNQPIQQTVNHLKQLNS